MDVKHKDLNLGDRSKADTYVGSLYGTYQISDQWFMQGVASFARSKIKNSELRREFGGMRTAHANYISDGWGSEVLLGYNYKIGSNMLLTPTAGFEYNRMNQIKYQETGTVNQNLLVTRKGVNRVEAILGARLSTSYQYKDWLIIPEAQGNIRHDLNGKKLNVDIKQAGVEGPSLIPRTSRVSRTIGNLGVAISARNSERMEYGIEYDARLAEKYIGHQGTLKVRMNF
jgi:outer membrane autotransporter protein